MRNIKFSYLYRDGGNYKTWAEVVFSNPEDLSPEAVTSELRKAFMQDGLFIAHQIRIPDVLPYSHGNPTPDDHCFHEFDSVGLTVDAANDRFGRSIGDFLTEVSREASIGWRACDPFDRFHPIENLAQPSGRD
jgi:hypothetical protein